MPVVQPAPGGPAEREVERTGRRYAVSVRTAVLLVAASLTLFIVPVERSAPVVLALGLWSAFYWSRAARSQVVDTAVIAAVCLGARWIDPAAVAHDSTSWVVVAVSITAICHQWLCAPVPGFALTAALVAAYLTGAAIADPAGWTALLPLCLWIFAEAAMSRLLRALVVRAARAVDHGTTSGAQARRATEIAAARRADEREHLAAMHDTVAATMLAVGTGMVTGREPWLADRAARDLEVLSGRFDVPEGHLDLTGLIDDLAHRSRLTVDFRSPGPVPVPAVPAVALCRSAGEALENVARHAGVTTARITLTRSADAVRLEVTDTGRGFDPEAISPHRRGISSSIVDRMARAGGRAAVSTAPGRGTRVDLEWRPRG
ncbi:sensor histidine kinase [Amycolatopsis sp. YIM 10]|uniref:sensor histidine kinase n=1 Tax=Amycolatopsis sp. YIM 10 TaxID=2653857 RepID=UPI00129052F3|nr:ATP-binding protein [Amycolatopsis sp. YIM 10]QFU89898.1 Sensor histidine kinase LiaS [Amycolatopsis sp. YIM 10]